MNPRVGSGTQQAHEPLVEQTVAVVRNHEGGTCGSSGNDPPKALSAGQPARRVGSGHQWSCRWRGGLWKTLKEALGGTEPSGARCVFKRATRQKVG